MESERRARGPRGRDRARGRVRACTASDEATTGAAAAPRRSRAAAEALGPRRRGGGGLDLARHPRGAAAARLGAVLALGVRRRRRHLGRAVADGRGARRPDRAGGRRRPLPGRADTRDPAPRRGLEPGGRGARRRRRPLPRQRTCGGCPGADQRAGPRRRRRRLGARGDDRAAAAARLGRETSTSATRQARPSRQRAPTSRGRAPAARCAVPTSPSATSRARSPSAASRSPSSTPSAARRPRSRVSESTPGSTC